MAARPTHDLAVKTGEYTDRNTGQTKGRWLRIGTVIQHDDGGTSIKLDAVPVGLPDWDGWVNVFKKQDRQQGQGQGQPAQPAPQGPGGAAPPEDFEDDIPF
jgi:hypothetical protein